ncbi:MAG: hypothetical protein J6K80_01850 [Oscillospiraceae bacterium]|nr:hypothetical protein [Oscillospiraceae bacterium]
MKKENVILIKFLGLMSTAVLMGVIAGRMALPLSTGQIFLPQAMISGPLLTICAVFLVFYRWRKNKPKQAKQAAVLGFTGLGAVLSGLCGFYTVSDVPFLVLCTLMSLFVALMAVFVQNSDERVHRRQLYSSPAEKICAIIFFTSVFFSAFVPTGPVAVLLTGGIWLFFTEKR